MKFKNRAKELSYLNNLYNENSSKLILFYGRRRVGKSELLKKFIKEKKGLYLLFNQESLNDQLENLSMQLSIFFDDDFLRINSFSKLEGFFSYLANKISKKRIPVVFDEFPYFIESSKKVLSVFQNYWDNHFSEISSFIIFCGSSISMMNELAQKKSPIYGRRTEQFLLEPLKFRDACLFFPSIKNLKDKIIFYSVLGGMPAYLLEFNFNKSLRYNLINNLLQKNKFLYQDVLFSLKEELSDPKNYFSILASISKGNTKLGNIVNDTGFEKSFVNKYLSVLINLQIIERIVPITEKNYFKSRRGIYKIKDNFFNFWFRYIFGNEIYVEQCKQDLLVQNNILPDFNSYCGRVFEDVVLEELVSDTKFKNYVFGKHWDRVSETDIVGINKEDRKIIIGEIKFRKLTDSELRKEFFLLRKKAPKINIQKYREIYCVVFLDKNKIVYNWKK